MSAGDAAVAGERMHALVRELYPVCRSITGDGLRRTLQRIGQEIPLTLHEVPSGTPVLDWTIPDEWNIREAWIAGPDGRRVVDFANHSLHVVGYSEPVRRRMPLADLRPHLHSLPDHPDWIPYRTSYYRRTWGFCLPHRVLETLTDGDYEVCIDSTIAPGSLTYAECVLPGESRDEVLFSCHSCHPSLANDNLAGIAVAVELARRLRDRPRRHTFRFLFVPGTIGSIAWLSHNETAIGRIMHGLVLSCLGDPGRPHYKRSRRGDAAIDRAVAHVMQGWGTTEVRDFVPYGYDERQYCSPGFNLPVGCLTRTPNGEYPEYHTSADNAEFVTPGALADSLELLEQVVDVLERNGRWRNLSPKGEPQLGRRGLYRATGGTGLPGYEMALLWVLNLSDGEHSLLDIAERARLPFATIAEAAAALEGAGLLAPI